MSSRLRVAFMGSPDFAVPSLEAVAKTCELLLVVSQPDRPAGRGRKLRKPAVKTAAEALGVEVVQPDSVRDGALERRLRSLALDLIVVTAYGRILPRAVLEASVHGCINVHASVLPRWRGAAPIQRAILAGDAETGVSIMQLDEGCDTGPVFCTRSISIGAEETAGQLFERLAVLGGEVLAEFLQRFPDVPAAVPQDASKAVHAAKLEKSEGRVVWRSDARAVVDHIRGMDPWPGARCSRGDDTLKLFGASISEDQPRSSVGPPTAGEVLGVDAHGLWVACGSGTVRIREVQAPGKKRMLAHQYASGHAFAPGERLG